MQIIQAYTALFLQINIKSTIMVRVAETYIPYNLYQNNSEIYSFTVSFFRGGGVGGVDFYLVHVLFLML